MHPDWLYVHTETADALADGLPVVAMESTLISHGLPWPANLETARQAEAAVRAAGAVPATVAVVRGRPTLGLNDRELEEFARATGVVKASRRDLGAAVGLKRTAATTVSATMVLARAAGVRVLGYRTDEFPAFCVRGSGGPVSARVESPVEAATVYDAHVRMGGRGAILVQPVDAAVAVSAVEF